MGMNRLLFQGLFHAPQVVGEALKGACFVAHVMGALGYACNPTAGTPRTDIIQAVQLGERAKVLAFCEAEPTIVYALLGTRTARARTLTIKSWPANEPMPCVGC